jgi:arginase
VFFRTYRIVEAPSALGLKPSGVEKLSQRLLSFGLAERLDARHGVRVEPAEYKFERDPKTKTLNADAIASWSCELADAVETVLDGGDFPVVLGGDCLILLGPTLALKRRGRYGRLRVACRPATQPVELRREFRWIARRKKSQAGAPCLNV